MACIISEKLEEAIRVHRGYSRVTRGTRQNDVKIRRKNIIDDDVYII